MNTTHLLAASLGGLISPINAFMLVMVLSFLLCLVVGIRNDSVSEFFSANRDLSTLRNTLALCGDWILTSTLLGTVSAVALGGFDGMLVAASFTAAPAVLLLLAAPLRATGRYTLGGILARRFPGDTTRIAGSVVTVAISVPLTVIQLTVAGDATAFVLGLDSHVASQVCTALIGTLIIAFAAFGGMRGSSMIQIVKTVLICTTLLALAYFALRRAGWDLSTILEGAGQQNGDAQSYYSPGKLYGDSAAGKLDVVSLGITAALGFAVLPHVLMRLNVFRDGRAASRGAAAAVVVLALCASLMAITGLSAAALVGDRNPIASNGQQDVSGIFQLAASLDEGTNGDSLLTLVACAVFVTALSTASGLTLSVGSLAHDLYSSSPWRSRAEEGREVSLARWFILVSGTLSLFLALKLHTWSIVSITFVFAIAASTVLPALTYSFFWKGFTRTGLHATLYGSLACCILLHTFSKSTSGSPVALLPEHDFHWLPLHHIALVSIPIGFFLGWAGSRFRPASDTGGASFSNPRARSDVR